jgi:hypothetical protein
MRVNEKGPERFGQKSVGATVPIAHTANGGGAELTAAAFSGTVHMQGKPSSIYRDTDSRLLKGPQWSIADKRARETLPLHKLLFPNEALYLVLAERAKEHSQ